MIKFVLITIYLIACGHISASTIKDNEIYSSPSGTTLVIDRENNTLIKGHIGGVLKDCGEGFDYCIAVPSLNIVFAIPTDKLINKWELFGHRIEKRSEVKNQLFGVEATWILIESNYQTIIDGDNCQRKLRFTYSDITGLAIIERLVLKCKTKDGVEFDLGLSEIYIKRDWP